MPISHRTRLGQDIFAVVIIKGSYKHLDIAILRAPALTIQARCQAIDGDPAALSIVSRELSYSNPTFYDQMTYHPAAKHSSPLRKYINRMTYRTTPLAGLAGVGLLHSAENTNTHIGCHALERHLSIDLGWISATVEALEQTKEVRPFLNWRCNPFVEGAGDAVWRHSFDTTLATHSQDIVIVRSRMLKARHFLRSDRLIPYGEWLRTINLWSATTSQDRYAALLECLIDQHMLISDLRVNLLSNEPDKIFAQKLYRLRDCIPACLPVNEVLRQFDRVQSDITRAQGLTPALDSLSGALKRREIQVNSTINLSSQGISKAILTDAVRLGETLLRLSPQTMGTGGSLSLHSQFIEKYGYKQFVPFEEVLRLRRTRGNSPTRGPKAQSERKTRLLLSLVGDAYRTHSPIIYLADRDVDELATPTDPSDGYLPASIDVAFFIHASSTESMNQGKYKLVISPLVGSQAAGRSWARFTSQIPSLKPLLKAIYNVRDPHELVCELSYLPCRFSATNLAQRPPIFSLECAFDCGQSRQGSSRVAVTEIEVGIWQGRLTARLRRSQKRLRLTETHSLNPTNAPLAVKVLQEICSDGVTQLKGFDWGLAASMPMLPRIEVDKLVLSAAQWRIPTRQFFHMSHSQCEAAFEALAKNWSIPRRIFLGDGDERILLDLSDAQERSILLKALRLSPQDVTVRETVGCVDSAWLEGEDGNRIGELVVPLVRTDLSEAVMLPIERRRTGQPKSRKSAGAIHHFPGRRWLYIKLYCDPACEEIALREFVRSLQLRPQTRIPYFFLRYSDPEPHLRFRMFLGRRQFAKIAAIALDIAAELGNDRVISQFSIETYIPEIERFGGPRGIELAEEIFCAMSSEALMLFELESALECKYDRTLLCILSVSNLLDAMLIDLPDQIELLGRGVGKSISKERIDRDVKDRAYQEINSLSGRILDRRLDCLLEFTRTTVSGIAQRWTQADVLIELSELASDLIHLQCNRILGRDRNSEGRARALLGQVLLRRLKVGDG